MIYIYITLVGNFVFTRRRQGGQQAHSGQQRLAQGLPPASLPCSTRRTAAPSGIFILAASAMALRSARPCAKLQQRAPPCMLQEGPKAMASTYCSFSVLPVPSYLCRSSPSNTWKCLLKPSAMPSAAARGGAASEASGCQASALAQSATAVLSATTFARYHCGHRCPALLCSRNFAYSAGLHRYVHLAAPPCCRRPRCCRPAAPLLLPPATASAGPSLS